MKHTKILAAALLAMGSVSAFADFDANLELDTKFLNKRENTNMAGANAREGGLEQSGRVEVNASKKTGSGGFVAGKASLIAKRDGTAVTDDMWGQIGTDAFNVKLGRFEAYDLFPLSRDVVIADADEGGYKANVLRGRTARGFHGALGFNVGGGLAIELGLVENKFDATPDAKNDKGVRPVISYANGPLNVAFGFESGSKHNNATTTTNESGFGLTAGYKFGTLKVTGNLANGKVDGVVKAQSFAVTLDSDAGFTVGLVSNSSTPTGGSASKSQMIYGAYSMPLFDIKGAALTFAASNATASGTNKADNDTRVAARLNYAF
jgi:hypothetical protein